MSVTARVGASLGGAAWLAAALLVTAGPAAAQVPEPTRPSAAEPGSQPGPGSAVAGPEAVLRHIDAGDLIAASSALDAAYRAPSLSREQLAQLTLLRAVLAYANDRLGLLEEALAGLATLDPPEAMLEDLPPPARLRYEELRRETGPVELGVELATEVRDGRRVGRLVPSAVHDPGRLVLEARVSASVDGGPLRRVDEGEALQLGDPHRDAVIRYLLEAVGQGGARLRVQGSADDPLRLEVPALPPDDTFLHVTLVTIASVLLAAGVAFGFAYVLTDELTQGRATRVGRVDCCGM